MPLPTISTYTPVSGTQGSFFCWMSDLQRAQGGAEEVAMAGQLPAGDMPALPGWLQGLGLLAQRSRQHSCARLARQATSAAGAAAHLMMLGTSFSVMIFWEGLGMAKELCRRTFWVVLSLTTPFWP